MPHINPQNSFSLESGINLQTQITNVNLWTGTTPNLFYPLIGNPSGFLTSATAGGVNFITATGTPNSGVVSGNVVLTGAGNVSVSTGVNRSIVISGDTGAYVVFALKSETGQFVVAQQTGLLTNVFYPLNSNPLGYLTASSGVGVRMIVPTGTAQSGNISGNVIFTGAGNVTTSTGISGHVVVSGNTGMFANFVTLSQTGNVVNTSQTGGFASVQVTGSPLLSLVNLTGAGNVTVVTGARPLVIVSGNTGAYSSFVTLSQTGGFLTATSLDSINTWTGTTPTLFYPLTQNPSGYVREFSGAIYVTGFTGNIFDGQLLIGSTGRNAYVSGHLKGVSGIVVVSGSGTLTIAPDATIVRTGQTGALVNQFYPLNSNPAGYATSAGAAGVTSIAATGTINTGLFTGSVMLSGAGSVIVSTGNQNSRVIVISGTASASNTGELTGVFYPLKENPSGYLATASGILTLSGATGIKDGQLLIGSTGDSAFIQGDLVTTSGIAIISGSGFIVIGADNTLVRTSQTGGFTSVQVTGSPLLPLVNLTGAGNVTVTTGGVGGSLVTINGNTGAYANFITSGSTHQYLNFTTNTNNPSYLEGRLFYDSGEKALAYYNENSNVTLNIGQEHWIRVINVSNATISNGKVVYITGAVSGLSAISLAQANSESGSFAIGVTTVDVAQSGRGYVTTAGVVHSINTSGFIPGTKLYLSETTAGGFTNTRPTGNNWIRPMGYVLTTGISGLTGHVMVVPYRNDRPDNFYLSGSGVLGAGNVSVSIQPNGITVSGNTGAYANFVTLSQTGNVVNTSQTGVLLDVSSISGANEIWIPAGALTPGVTNGAVTGQIVTGDMVFDTMDFRQAGVVSAYFNLSIPQTWDDSAVKGKFFWTETGVTGTTGTVVWGLAGLAIKNNSLFNVAFGTGQQVTGVSTTGLRMHEATTPFMLISGSTGSAFDCFFKVYRYSGSLSGNARLIGLSLQYYNTGVNQITY